MPSAFSWPVLVPYALRAPAPVNLGVRPSMRRPFTKQALKVLAILPLTAAFFLIFSNGVVAPLEPLISFGSRPTIEGILLVTVLYSTAFAAMGSAIIAIPVALIYGRLAPIAALMIWSPFFYLGSQAIVTKSSALLFSTLYPIACEALIIPTAANFAYRWLQRRRKLISPDTNVFEPRA